jgi:hypothetical protein
VKFVVPVIFLHTDVRAGTVIRTLRLSIILTASPSPTEAWSGTKKVYCRDPGPVRTPDKPFNPRQSKALKVYHCQISGLAAVAGAASRGRKVRNVIPSRRLTNEDKSPEPTRLSNKARLAIFKKHLIACHTRAGRFRTVWGWVVTARSPTRHG